MAKPSGARNPFYLALIPIGVLFVVTACGLAIVTVRDMDPARSVAPSASGQWLLSALSEYGTTALLAELASMAVATFAAIGTDPYWVRRAQRRACKEKGH